jgi:hypothetical protein
MRRFIVTFDKVIFENYIFKSDDTIKEKCYS